MIVMMAYCRENLGEPPPRIVAAVPAIGTLFLDVGVVFLLHLKPNISNVICSVLAELSSVQLIDPVPPNELVGYSLRSHFVLTDSGGLQEEAMALSKPVLLLREETERSDRVDLGGSLLIGSDTELIVSEASELPMGAAHSQEVLLGITHMVTAIRPCVLRVAYHSVLWRELLND
jgi:UDP-N-acetylglucosamine 2-epimerase (non-hydrolysing)